MLPNADMTEVGERVRERSSISSPTILMFALDRESHFLVARSNVSMSAVQFTRDQIY